MYASPLHQSAASAACLGDDKQASSVAGLRPRRRQTTGGNEAEHSMPGPPIARSRPRWCQQRRQQAHQTSSHCSSLHSGGAPLVGAAWLLVAGLGCERPLWGPPFQLMPWVDNVGHLITPTRARITSPPPGNKEARPRALSRKRQRSASFFRRSRSDTTPPHAGIL